MFREPFRDPRWRLDAEAVWRPPTDVYETDDSIVVRVEIAGLTSNDYEVVLSGRVLTITGERRDPSEKLAYQQMEIRHGKFRTQVQLPWQLESTGQSASYEAGFIKVILPKAAVRRVPIVPSTDE